jgi:hypothetical protein
VACLRHAQPLWWVDEPRLQHHSVIIALLCYFCKYCNSREAWASFGSFNLIKQENSERFTLKLFGRSKKICEIRSLISMSVFSKTVTDSRKPTERLMIPFWTAHGQLRRRPLITRSWLSFFTLGVYDFYRRHPFLLDQILDHGKSANYALGHAQTRPLWAPNDFQMNHICWSLANLNYSGLFEVDKQMWHRSNPPIIDGNSVLSLDAIFGHYTIQNRISFLPTSFQVIHSKSDSSQSSDQSLPNRIVDVPAPYRQTDNHTQRRGASSDDYQSRNATLVNFVSVISSWWFHPRLVTHG